MVGLEVVVAVLIGLLAVTATLMVWYGLFGWVGGGVRRCEHCHFLYLTRWGHASNCPRYPHPLHALSSGSRRILHVR